MSDEFLKGVVQLMLNGQQVVDAATAQLPHIRTEIENGEYTFMDIPSPDGSRSLQALNKAGCRILVCQFNRNGLHHVGTAIREVAGCAMIINMPPDFADYVYHKAIAIRN